MEDFHKYATRKGGVFKEVSKTMEKIMTKR